jgi:hypothetical protein
MKIKIWDEPLGMARFRQCILRLDQTFSDTQIKALFKKLKTGEEVDIQILLNNICGSSKDTVDYKNKMFRQLYDDIFKKDKQDQL